MAHARAAFYFDARKQGSYMSHAFKSVVNSTTSCSIAGSVSTDTCTRYRQLCQAGCSHHEVWKYYHRQRPCQIAIDCHIAHGATHAFLAVNICSPWAFKCIPRNQACISRQLPYLIEKMGAPGTGMSLPRLTNPVTGWASQVAP